MTKKKKVVVKPLSCACCGRNFFGWQHQDRDTGFGICSDKYCATAYGYHTEIFQEHGTEYVIDEGEE